MADVMQDRRFAIGALSGVAGMAALVKMAQAGPLNPPAGPIASTGRTVQEIYDKIARTDAGLAEPRVPVQSLPGSATALHVISQPGSYYLTGDIQGVAGKDGIALAANDITLDLSGFAVRGVAGSGSGIGGFSAVNRVQISGGRVIGWGIHGVFIFAGRGHAIRGVIAESNADNGIAVNTDCVLESCAAMGNRYGFQVQGASIISECTARSNMEYGFLLGNSIATRCIALFNAANAGFASEGGATFIECISQANARGIFHNGVGTVRDCLVSENTVVGISVVGNNACRVEGNHVVNNLGPGIVVQGPNRHLVLRNTASNNTGGNYLIDPASSYGPIVNVAGAGDISTVPGANHPWANFIF